MKAPAIAVLLAAVPFSRFADELGARIDATAVDPSISAEYDALCSRHRIDPDTPDLLRDFVRARILFEATRDGGLWRLKWAVTDQEPGSRMIWKAWRAKKEFFGPPTATAECDEISGLYAFLAKRVGVRAVGLFYPTWNHTIAAWQPLALGKPDAGFRILIPTTQIFLSCDAGFDTTTFDPRAQRVWEYPLRDIREDAALAPELAQFLLSQIEAYAPVSAELLSLLRLDRAARFGSSAGACTETRRALADVLRARGLSAADASALARYGRDELGTAGGAVLDGLAP